MRVLHDMDFANRRPLVVLKRAIRLIVYALSRIFRIRISAVDDIYEEVRENADTLIKLDRLVGVTSVMGIKTEVLNTYPNIMEELREYDDVDVREHIHIGDKNYPFGWRQSIDPNRKRLWVPPLDQPKETWSYGLNYVAGKRILLKDGQLPIWHVHHPKNLKHYIDFLYWVLVEGGKIYEEGGT